MQLGPKVEWSYGQKWSRTGPKGPFPEPLRSKKINFFGSCILLTIFGRGGYYLLLTAYVAKTGQKRQVPIRVRKPNLT